MGLLLSTRRALLGGAGGYNEKVLSTGPIAYWPQDESTGTVARCLVDSAQNGTYTAVTLANDNTGPFGTPAPWFDGATSFNDVYSAALAAAFSGVAGSAMIWAKVNAAGTWTDASTRFALELLTDANNQAYMRKRSVNNQLDWRFTGGAVGTIRSKNPVSSADWMCLLMTWGGGTAQAYYNGATEGAAWAIGAWAGALNINQTVIGAQSNAAATPWHGWLGPCALWDRKLPTGEAESLYVA